MPASSSLVKSLYREIVKKATYLDSRGLTDVAMQRYAEFLPRAFIVETPAAAALRAGRGRGGPGAGRAASAHPAAPAASAGAAGCPGAHQRAMYPRGEAAFVARRAFRHPLRPGEETSRAIASAFAFIKAMGDDAGELQMYVLADEVAKHPHDWLCALCVMAAARRMDESSGGAQSPSTASSCSSASSCNLQGHPWEDASAGAPPALREYRALYERLDHELNELADVAARRFVELCQPSQSPKRSDAAAPSAPPPSAPSAASDVPASEGHRQPPGPTVRVADRPTRRMTGAANHVVRNILQLVPDRGSESTVPLFLDTALAAKRAHPLLLAVLYVIIIERTVAALNMDPAKFVGSCVTRGAGAGDEPHVALGRLIGGSAVANATAAMEYVPLLLETAVVGTPDRRRSMVRVGRIPKATPTATAAAASASDAQAPTDEHAGTASPSQQQQQQQQRRRRTGKRASKPCEPAPPEPAVTPNFGYINVAANGDLVPRKEAAFLMTGDAAAMSINSVEALAPQSCREVLCGLMFPALLAAAMSRNTSQKGEGRGRGGATTIRDDRREAGQEGAAATDTNTGKRSTLLASLFLILDAS